MTDEEIPEPGEPTQAWRPDDTDATQAWRPTDTPPQGQDATGPASGAGQVWVPAPDEPGLPTGGTQALPAAAVGASAYREEAYYEEPTGPGGRGWIIAIVTLLVLIAAVAGLLYGLSRNKDDPSPTTTTPTTASTTTSTTTTSTTTTSTSTSTTTTTAPTTTSTAPTTTAPTTTAPTTTAPTTTASTTTTTTVPTTPTT